jgi:hypothetical protein
LLSHKTSQGGAMDWTQVWMWAWLPVWRFVLTLLWGSADW